MFEDSEQHLCDRDLATQPAITRDNHHVEIVANVGNVEDTHLALQHGTEGIGLLRTEFLFLNRNQPPDERTQFSAYRTILELMENRPVVERTLDIGGDKEVPYFDFGPEANPFLGYRAIRISLGHPDDFKLQLRALLHAGPGCDLRIMFPIIASLDEVLMAKSLFAEARTELHRDMKNRYNSSSLAVCKATQEGGWIVGSKNDADYTDMRETVRARRQHAQLNTSFSDVFLRPYSLGVDWYYLLARRPLRGMNSLGLLTSNVCAPTLIC